MGTLSASFPSPNQVRWLPGSCLDITISGRSTLYLRSCHARNRELSNRVLPWGIIEVSRPVEPVWGSGPRLKQALRYRQRMIDMGFCWP
ncbi:hypothetical protein AB1N83_012789 [Pleurotus pulmonarius]